MDIINKLVRDLSLVSSILIGNSMMVYEFDVQLVKEITTDCRLIS